MHVYDGGGGVCNCFRERLWWWQWRQMAMITIDSGYGSGKSGTGGTGSRWTPSGDFPPVISPRSFPPWWSPPDLESLLERMKRLDFSKPVTRRLTPGSNDYTNRNTNPTRPSQHVTWTGGDHWGKLPGESSGEITGGNYRGEIAGGEFTCFEWYHSRNN